MITLCASIFDWAHYYHKKGAIKLHTVLNYNTNLPEIIVLGSGTTGDNIAAIDIPMPKNSIVVGDRAYSDTKLLACWDYDGVYFVVRAKSPQYISSVQVQELELPEGTPDSIIIDEVMNFTGQHTPKQYPKQIRRTVVYDSKEDRTFDLWSNNFTWTAEEISELYKARWEIETFFKTVKQNLNIKSFMGTSLNAVLIQVWASMIVMLLLTIIRLRAKKAWSMSNLVVLLKMLLLNQEDLFDIVNRKGGKDPPVKNDEFGIQGRLLL